MQGWSYLEGKRWSDVTRDERFFCQRLFVLAQSNLELFVEHLRHLSPVLPLANAEWELGYEVCFYRDFHYARAAQGLVRLRPDLTMSHKRTWDLCLFSNDQIVIVEAKAQQAFDQAQLGSFKQDEEHVEALTGIKPTFLFLASSRYLTENVRQTLSQQFPTSSAISWKDLAEVFSRDKDLLRADSLFADTHKTGDELIAHWRSGAQCFIGRSGGLLAVKGDIQGGAWKTRLYATTEANANGQRNWFSLEEFVQLVAPNA